MLLRLEMALLPSDAKVYETLLQDVIGDFQVAATAPGVTRSIVNTEAPDTMTDVASTDIALSADNDSSNDISDDVSPSNTPSATGSGITADIPTATAPSNTNNGTTYSWRGFLKDYEEFVDAYIIILKKVENNPTDPTILGEYMSMMTKSLEWMTKYEDISDSLNEPKELTEFLNEWTRIYTKLINAMAS